MKRVAIIGTRNPNEVHKKVITELLNKVSKEDTEIISGCAEGIDEFALKTANELNIPTIGVIPWKSYNRPIQAYCSTILTDKDISADDKNNAIDSVYKYHPALQYCSDGAIQLHARNYIIVYKADLVLAFPYNMSGGTMQGVRICRGENINYLIINDVGEEVSSKIEWIDNINWKWRE